MALTGYLFLSALGVLAGGMVSARFAHHGRASQRLAWRSPACSALAIGMVDLSSPALIMVASVGGFFSERCRPARDMILRAATPQGRSARCSASSPTVSTSAASSRRWSYLLHWQYQLFHRPAGENDTNVRYTAAVTAIVTHTKSATLTSFPLLSLHAHCIRFVRIRARA